MLKVKRFQVHFQLVLLAQVESSDYINYKIIIPQSKMQNINLDNMIKIEDSMSPAIKSRKILKNIKESQSEYKFYSWDIVENYSYITYLTNFRYIFESQAQRKRIKVFRHLAKLIKTRNPHQIKSHHQKMMLRHKTIDAIIDFLRFKITKELNIKPDYIPVIERINKEAEQFFLNEFHIQNFNKSKFQIKKSNTRADQKQKCEQAPKLKIKVQDEQTIYFASQLKQESVQHFIPVDQCFKQEQKDDLIVRIPF